MVGSSAAIFSPRRGRGRRRRRRRRALKKDTKNKALFGRSLFLFLVGIFFFSFTRFSVVGKSDDDIYLKKVASGEEKNFFLGLSLYLHKSQNDYFWSGRRKSNNNNFWELDFVTKHTNSRHRRFPRSKIASSFSFLLSFRRPHSRLVLAPANKYPSTSRWWYPLKKGGAEFNDIPIKSTKKKESFYTR